MEPGDEPAEGRLPRPALPDQAERLPALDLEGHVVDGVDRLRGSPHEVVEKGTVEREVLHHARDLEERGRHGMPSTSSEKKHAAR